MDSIFVLDEGDRCWFLRQMMQKSFGCVYICLWSYLPSPSNCLLALEGLYGETSTQPGLARQLFDVYRESVIYVDTGRIPGLAFKNNIPYIELKAHDFQRLVSGEVQLQFYREAGVKTVVLMGCATGEIELGMANDPQAELEKEMKKLINSVEAALHPPCSRSSSSLSMDSHSPETLFSINTPSSSTNLVGPLVPLSSSAPPPQPPQGLPTTIELESEEDAAMTKAILAVLSTTNCAQKYFPNDLRHSPTAFTRYAAGAGSSTTRGIHAVNEKQNKFKRAVLFFRNLDWRRRQDLLEVVHQAGNRPNVHHMISERRRREKLNESFHVLRSLLPPGSKKDKASVLSSTTEYLSSLKSQVAELVKKNQMLESQLLAPRKSQHLNVEITQVSESRLLDLRVSVGAESNMLDLITRLIDFLKQQRNVSLLSFESNTTMPAGSLPLHVLMLTLKIEGHEFDASGFEEGVRRVADDHAQ